MAICQQGSLSYFLDLAFQGIENGINTANAVQGNEFTRLLVMPGHSSGFVEIHPETVADNIIISVVCPAGGFYLFP